MGQDRLFTLEWNNSKLHIRPDERYKQRRCRGVHFANGVLALNNGVIYITKSEMEYHLSTTGQFQLLYDDEQIKEVSKHEQVV